jgi:hypothetical protein
MKGKLSLLTRYLAIQRHVFSVVNSTSSQHKELKENTSENIAKIGRSVNYKMSQ